MLLDFLGIRKVSPRVPNAKAPVGGRGPFAKGRGFLVGAASRLVEEEEEPRGGEEEYTQVQGSRTGFRAGLPSGGSPVLFSIHQASKGHNLGGKEAIRAELRPLEWC
jgi:hypothetical protein